LNNPANPPENLDILVEPTVVVPETKPVDGLLALMQRDRVHAAVVVDEFDSVTGLITVEDIVEPLVARSSNPTRRRRSSASTTGTRSCAATSRIEVVDETLGTELHARDTYETLAGLMLEKAGRMLDEGEVLETRRLVLSPVRVIGGRIRKVRVELPGDASRVAPRLKPQGVLPGRDGSSHARRRLLLVHRGRARPDRRRDGRRARLRRRRHRGPLL